MVKLHKQLQSPFMFCSYVSHMCEIYLLRIRSASYTMRRGRPARYGESFIFCSTGDQSALSVENKRSETSMKHT